MGTVLHEGIKTETIQYEDGPLYTVKSTLTVTPRKEHDNTTFTCQSQNAADRTPQSAKLRVEVNIYFIKRDYLMKRIILTFFILIIIIIIIIII